MTLVSVFVLLEVVSVPGWLTSAMGAVPLPLSVTVSSSALPLPIALGTVGDGAVSLLGRAMGVVVAMDPFFSPSHVIGFLLGGAIVMVVVVPMTLASVAAVAPLPPPLL